MWCLWWQSVSRKDMETLLPQSAAYRKKWEKIQDSRFKSLLTASLGASPYKNNETMRTMREDFRNQADSHSPNLQSTSQEQSLFNPCANNSCLICLAADSSFPFSNKKSSIYFEYGWALKYHFSAREPIHHAGKRNVRGEAVWEYHRRHKQNGVAPLLEEKGYFEKYSFPLWQKYSGITIGF